MKKLSCCVKTKPISTPPSWRSCAAAFGRKRVNLRLPGTSLGERVRSIRCKPILISFGWMPYLASGPREIWPGPAFGERDAGRGQAIHSKVPSLVHAHYATPPLLQTPLNLNFRCHERCTGFGNFAVSLGNRSLYEMRLFDQGYGLMSAARVDFAHVNLLKPAAKAPQHQGGFGHAGIDLPGMADFRAGSMPNARKEFVKQKAAGISKDSEIQFSSWPQINLPISAAFRQGPRSTPCYHRLRWRGDGHFC